MNLKPLGDRVIIKQDEAEETTASGLYLATEAKEKPQTGTVLAVGEGKLDKDGKLIPVPVKEGDKVNKGHVIGYVGETASSECGIQSHLHFEYLVNGAGKDPREYVLFAE